MNRGRDGAPVGLRRRGVVRLARCAEAGELGLAVARIQLANVVSSYLGETARNLEQIFGFLSRNAMPATAYFRLPPEQVVEIGLQIDL